MRTPQTPMHWCASRSVAPLIFLAASTMPSGARAELPQEPAWAVVAETGYASFKTVDRLRGAFAAAAAEVPLIGGLHLAVRGSASYFPPGQGQLDQRAGAILTGATGGIAYHLDTGAFFPTAAIGFGALYVQAPEYPEGDGVTAPALVLGLGLRYQGLAPWVFGAAFHYYDMYPSQAAFPNLIQAGLHAGATF